MFAGIVAGDRAAVAAAYAEFDLVQNWPSTEHGERYSGLMGLATYRNLDTSSRDFDQVWAIRERMVSQFHGRGV